MEFELNWNSNWNRGVVELNWKWKWKWNEWIRADGITIASALKDSMAAEWKWK